MTKNNFFILSGGPGSGKSTVLEYLNKKGYDHVLETGRQIIKERLLNKLPPRPEPKVFAQQMFNRDFENFLAHSNRPSLVYFDRSFVDSAYLIFQSNKQNFKSIKEILTKYRYNKKVFIAPPWKEIYRNDTERDQTFDEAISIYEQLLEWYQTNGYEAIAIPKGPIDKRAEFILSNSLS